MCTPLILIKNGRVVNADGIQEVDVLIENGLIKELGKNLNNPNAKIIDAQCRYVMPGGIDPHTHMEFEFMGTTTIDDYYTGTRAAVAGGTTMIIDFAFPKGNQSILTCYDEHRKRADPKVCCDYGFHMCLTNWSECVKKEMEILCKEKGVNSFKMFMAYQFMLNDSELYTIFEQCKRLGAVAQVHAENGHIIAKNVEKLKKQGVTTPDGHALSRPEEIEAEATNRACVIAHQMNCDLYVVHVMSKSAAQVIKDYRAKGYKVTGEALAAGLGSDSSHYQHSCFDHSAGHVISPPLRDPGTPEALMQFLAEDTLSTTGSDNCTHTKEQKSLGKDDFTKIPNGVNGVEDRMSVIWEKGVHTKILDPCRFVAVTSTNTAKMFNIFPKKGCIAVGSDADIVIWNPSKTRVISASTHNHAGNFNIFEGMECHGVPEYVLVRGKICVDNGKVDVVKGFGKFVPTPTKSC